MVGATRRRGLRGKYLRLQDLRRLEHVFFSGNRIVEGQYSGHHATPQRGQSVEFRDYRQYIPGDEISSVDWKVYGRSDKLFIKIFEHQADLTVHLLVDASASMAYQGIAGSPGWQKESKYDYACYLAASFGFLITKQHDRVGFAVARDGLAEFHRPQCSMLHVGGIVQTMERLRPQGSASLADAIREFAAKSRRRELLVIFSDLLDEQEDVLKSISAYFHRGGEVLVFHVMHEDELNLPQVSNAIFIDSESLARLRASVSEVRADYTARMKSFLENWSKACRGLGIDYTLCRTAEPYSQLLERYLSARARRR